MSYNDQYAEYFIYLDNLHSVGTTPECYRASIQASFDLGRLQATQIVKSWMKLQLKSVYDG